MEYVPKKKMQSDDLRILRLLGSGIYQFRFVKVLLVFQLLIHSIFQIIQIYLFLFKLNFEEIMQYGPGFFFWFYGILAILVLLIKPKLVENLFEELDMWSIDSGTRPTEIKIGKEMKLLKIFTLIYAFFILCCSSIFYISDIYYELFLPVQFCVDYVPKYSKLLTQIFKTSTYFALTSVFHAHLYQCVYYAHHSKYQIIMLQDHISAITKYPTKRFSKLIDPIDNALYQQETKHRLIYCIKRHQEILISANRKIGEISNILMYFSVCGFFAAASVLFRLILLSNTLLDLIIIGTGCVSVSIILSLCVYSGQIIETLSEEMNLRISEVEWYNMNCENRQLYLIFLICAQKKITVKVFGNYSLNYSLGLAIVRAVYAVISALLSIDLNMGI